MSLRNGMFSRMRAKRQRPARTLNRASHLRLEQLEGRYVLDSTVVFNELMYNPGVDQDLEWLELHNEMAVDMDLSGWQIDGVDYTFPQGTVMEAGGYLVVAKAPSDLQAATGFEAALGPYGGRLDNGGES
jgi:hypothetical protein